MWTPTSVYRVVYVPTTLWTKSSKQMKNVIISMWTPQQFMSPYLWTQTTMKPKVYGHKLQYGQKYVDTTNMLD